jgi:hypothetical protein
MVTLFQHIHVTRARAGRRYTIYLSLSVTADERRAGNGSGGSMRLRTSGACHTYGRHGPCVARAGTPQPPAGRRRYAPGGLGKRISGFLPPFVPPHIDNPRGEPDQNQPGLWRVPVPEGSRSDVVNLSRNKDASGDAALIALGLPPPGVDDGPRIPTPSSEREIGENDA